jgi:hypothetical protein
MRSLSSNVLSTSTRKTLRREVIVSTILVPQKKMFSNRASSGTEIPRLKRSFATGLPLRR